MRVEKRPAPELPVGEDKKIPEFIAPQPPGKIITLALLNVLASAIFWFSWHNVLVKGVTLSLGASNILTIVFALLAFCLMFCFYALGGVLITKKWVILLVSLAAALAIFIFFPVSLWSGIGAALMILTSLYWHREISIDLKSRLKFMPARTVAAGLKTAITLVLISASLVYYGYLVVGIDAQQKFTNSMVKTGSTAVENVLSMYFKDKFKPRMSLDTFLGNIAVTSEGKVEYTFGQKQLDEAISQGFARAQAELVVQARLEFLKTFGIEAAGDEEMQSVVEKIVRKNIDKYLGSYAKFIPALLALSVFLLLKIFSFVYYELIKSLSYILLRILVWVKFIKQKKIQVEAEKIIL